MSNYVQMEFDLRLSRAASLARTYPQQEKEPELFTGIDPLSGRRCYDSPEMYTQRGLLRKMYQPCDLRGLPWSYKISARSGMWENFIVYPLPPVAALRIKGTESGLLPTPRAKEPGRTTEGYGRGLAELVEGKTQLPAKKMKASQRWPPPTSRDWKDGSAKSCRNVPANCLLGREVHAREDYQTTGSLNPQWVEWLMGYPDGWTDLNSLETP